MTPERRRSVREAPRGVIHGTSSASGVLHRASRRVAPCSVTLPEGGQRKQGQSDGGQAVDGRVAASSAALRTSAALHARMGREESKDQAKAAQREKEAAAHAKKQERKDKTWEKGAKDTSKADASAASSAEAAERKAAAAAQVRVLVRLAAAAGGAGACVDAPGLATHPARSLAGPMSPGLAMTQG